MGFPKCDFFRKWTSLYVWTERPKICYHVYLYVIWYFVIHFFEFSWFFRKMSFLEIFQIFGKSDPRTPGPPDPRGQHFWERSGSKIRKNVVKVRIYGANYEFYLNFQNFDPILGPSGVDPSFAFSKTSKISKNQDFAKFLKMIFPKCDFFRKWTCLRVWTERPKICYHVYLYVI